MQNLQGGYLRKNMKLLIPVIMLLSSCNALSAGSYPRHKYAPNDKHHSNTSGSIRLTLLHHQYPCLDDLCSRNRSTSAQGQAPQLAASLFFRRRRPPPRNIWAPVTSAGAFYGFVAQISLGTPPTKHNVLFDTGSSFSRVQCRPCGFTPGCYRQNGPLFDTAASSTYRRLPCSSPSCLSASGATRNTLNCSVQDNTCSYRIEYSDLSASMGRVVTDRLTVGKETIPGFVFGCSHDHDGVFGSYSGIIGFGVHELSFLSQVAEAAHIYRAFSYYLPSPNSEGYLQVGNYDEGAFAFTPMFTAGQVNYLDLTGIMVDGHRLNLTNKQGTPTWCYLDTGTPLSVLPRYVFDQLSDAVAERSKGYQRVEDAPWCFDPWYWWTERAIPTVVMEFRDGAHLELDKERLMSEQSDGRLCLQFDRSSDGFYILGSTQMKRVYLVQDLEKSRTGFPIN